MLKRTVTIMIAALIICAAAAGCSSAENSTPSDTGVNSSASISETTTEARHRLKTVTRRRNLLSKTPKAVFQTMKK